LLSGLMLCSSSIVQTTWQITTGNPPNYTSHSQRLQGEEVEHPDSTGHPSIAGTASVGKHV
jgi:hypothetical protein